MQFGKLLEELYVACGLQVFRRVATGGSTTTVQDTGIANEFEENEFTGSSEDKHILFISQTTDRAEPEGEFGEISSFLTPTATPTFTVPTLSAAVAANDIYAVMKPTIQLYEMISRANEGLRRLMEREKVDVSLTALKDTLVYNLPLPIHRYRIQQIEVGNDTDGWRDAPAYTIEPNSGGTKDQLIFNAQPIYDATTPANETFKITYVNVHQTLSVYSDYVEKTVSDETAIAVCAAAAMEYLMTKRPSFFQDKSQLALFQNVMQRSEQAQQTSRQRLPPARRQTRIKLGEL